MGLYGIPRTLRSTLASTRERMVGAGVVGVLWDCWGAAAQLPQQRRLGAVSWETRPTADCLIGAQPSEGDERKAGKPVGSERHC